MCLHSCGFVHTILHSISFSKYTFPYINKVHTPAFWSAVERFMVASKVLNTLASYFPARFYFPLTLIDPCRILAWPPPAPLSFQPIHGVYVHPWGCVLVTLCPSSHPLFLPIIPLALCSKHMISATSLHEEDAIPIYQMTHWGSEIVGKLSIVTQPVRPPPGLRCSRSSVFCFSEISHPSRVSGAPPGRR